MKVPGRRPQVEESSERATRAFSQDEAMCRSRGFQDGSDTQCRYDQRSERLVGTVRERDGVRARDSVWTIKRLKKSQSIPHRDGSLLRTSFILILE